MSEAGSQVTSRLHSGSAPPRTEGIPRLRRPAWSPVVSLPGRRHLFARRRRALHLRAWMGIGVIVCFSVSLFAMTVFSLIGR